ncbi:MAG: energy transducer TonB [Bacteroidota bacterium]
MSQPFESINNSNDTKNRILAIIIATIFHVAIIFLLMLVVIKIPNPPFPERIASIEVDYGNTATGSGDEEPAPNDNPSLTQGNTNQNTSDGSTAKTTTTANATNAASNNNMTSEAEKDIPVTEVKSTSTKPTTNTTTNNSATGPVISTPTVNKNALYTKKPGAGSGAGASGNNPGSTSGSQGTAGGPGNQGDPSGTHSNNYSGVGKVNDGSYALAGRTAVTKPKASTNCAAKGTVVIKITVNGNGKVMTAKYTQSGSNTNDGCLIANAEETARRWVFNSDENEIQQGTITFVYKDR